MILNANISGEGEPLVLIHSGGSTGGIDYEKQKDFFTDKNFRVIRPDLRGHGKSKGNINDYWGHMAKDIFDTLESLNIDCCHIAGVSFGGIASLLFAKSFPNKVKSLTFSGVYPSKPKNWSNLLKEESKKLKQLLNDKSMNLMMEKLHGENNWEDLLIYSTKEGFYPFYETGHISDLQCPTLYLAGGELDREYWAAISYKQLNPYIHVAIIPLAGHLVHDEQPELYSHTLLKFINSIK